MQPPVQVFATPKLGNAEDEYEDASAFSLTARRFAMADGATESSFSDIWARSLVRKYVDSPPAATPTNQDLSGWLAPLQQEWHASIDWERLPWFAEEKAHSGAFAALLGLSFAGPEAGAGRRKWWQWWRKPPGRSGARWSALAIGDSCLFQVRGTQLLKAFPLSASAAFSPRPLLLGSKPERNRMVWKAISFAEGESLPGDCFVLCTDALAKWFLQEHEAGRRPWEGLARVASKEEYVSLIGRLRGDKSLKNDDTTLMLFRWPPWEEGPAGTA